MRVRGPQRPEYSWTKGFALAKKGSTEVLNFYNFIRLVCLAKNPSAYLDFAHALGTGPQCLKLDFLCRVQYGKMLEQSTFLNKTEDFIWMMVVGCGTMLVNSKPYIIHSSFSDATQSQCRSICLR